MCWRKVLRNNCSLYASNHKSQIFTKHVFLTKHSQKSNCRRHYNHAITMSAETKRASNVLLTSIRSAKKKNVFEKRFAALKLQSRGARTKKTIFTVPSVNINWFSLDHSHDFENDQENDQGNDQEKINLKRRKCQSIDWWR